MAGIRVHYCCNTNLPDQLWEHCGRDHEVHRLQERNGDVGWVLYVWPYHLGKLDRQRDRPKRHPSRLWGILLLKSGLCRCALLIKDSLRTCNQRHILIPHRHDFYLRGFCKSILQWDWNYHHRAAVQLVFHESQRHHLTTDQTCAAIFVFNAVFDRPLLEVLPKHAILPRYNKKLSVWLILQLRVWAKQWDQTLGNWLFNWTSLVSWVVHLPQLAAVESNHYG